MNSLYELISDLKELQEIDFMEAKANQIEEIKAIIEEQIKTKGTGIILIVRNLESDIEVIKAEIKRLQDLKKSKENKVENLKKYTKECLEEADIKKISTSLGNISLRKLPGSVEVLEEDSILKEYKKEVITITIDKKAILADLKEGIVINGVTLKTGTSLSIK
ncbi:siphovirus Gp157 family protein [Terrisporobacter mayombei]|uniref:siphovirus Gp157 family protein n=1 Tax=Terrisporobacter mayombei TaxID=1541 RepID=UPI00265A1703|nr:siphovirus Gp157 family protein [Terrisporobacter mayombei]MCC3668642.1 siphovirus Gp157 family protein [Terrisporobacter mayombei]